MAQRQVLTATQTTSDTFRFKVPRTTEAVNQQIITFPGTDTDTWTGGTWDLQMLVGGVWVDQDQQWDAFGSKAFYAISGEAYRLTGGSAGATAYASDVT